MTPVSALDAIQAMLAPVLAISAVGLLLLGVSNRYSTMISRIRSLNDERRKYLRHIADQGELPYTDSMRFMSVSQQTRELLVRVRLARNGILSLQAAIGLFVLTSVGIGINILSSSLELQLGPLFSFLLGMILVFVGVVFAGIEVSRSFRIVRLEVHADE